MPRSLPPDTCTQCGGTTPNVELPKRGRICLSCRRANARAYYRSHREYYVAKAMRRNAQTTQEVRTWLMEYLQTHPCIDCGTDDPRVLEFDHREPSDKRSEISVLATNGYSLATVMTEVAKCDVRCANCHRIRTRVVRGWWKG